MMILSRLRDRNVVALLSTRPHESGRNERTTGPAAGRQLASCSPRSEDCVLKPLPNGWILVARVTTLSRARPFWMQIELPNLLEGKPKATPRNLREHETFACLRSSLFNILAVLLRRTALAGPRLLVSMGCSASVTGRARQTPASRGPNIPPVGERIQASDCRAAAAAWGQTNPRS